MNVESFVGFNLNRYFVISLFSNFEICLVTILQKKRKSLKTGEKIKQGKSERIIEGIDGREDEHRGETKTERT